MAELFGNVYQGDSWNYPGMKDTQILHTNSEDVSSESPSHARVEEQSSLKKVASGDPSNLRATQSPVIASLAAADSSSPAQKPSTTSDAAHVQADRHLTISNSSNSSACCMPSLAPQAGPSYDINASARTAEHRHHCLPPSDAHHPHYTTAAAPQSQLPGGAQLHSQLPDRMLRAMMASAFEDVDSGRHRLADGEPAHVLPGHFMHHRRRIAQQDSILPAYRAFFPPVDAPLMPSEQQQLNHFQLQQLQQLLPPELLDRPQHHRPQHTQHAQHTQQQLDQEHQEPVQSSFTSFPDVPHLAGDAPHQMPSDMQQWPSPAGSTARQARSFAAAQHDLEDLDITGLKRDFSSFTDPASRVRQPQPAPRRALSFTQASPASAASPAAAAAASSAGASGRRGGSMSHAASNSRLSSPGSHVVSPPDTDASLSDSDDASGSDSAGANTKRRKLVKGKRGGGRRPRRMVCKNCGANQTPQWRCGPDGPRTLCNACGVRYKKGLPLTGGAMNGSS